MDDYEIVALFDSDTTAKQVARALNSFLLWMHEDGEELTKDFFEDFGVNAEDYLIDAEDRHWSDPPRARVRGNKIAVEIEEGVAAETITELLEALGALDIGDIDDAESEDD